MILVVIVYFMLVVDVVIILGLIILVFFVLRIIGWMNDLDLFMRLVVLVGVFF